MQKKCLEMRINMTLIQLKYAITVAGENSLNDAAKVLLVSQPSLSSAINS